MARSASLFGLLGLLFLAFGFIAAMLLGPASGYALANLVAGGALVLAYLAFGFEDFRSVLGQRSTRYGAIASRIGKVRNTLAGVAFSDCELFSNLELTQQTYDLLRGDADELDYPLSDRDVVQAVRETAQALRKRVVGQVTMLSGDEVGALVDEIAAIYASEATLRAELQATTRSYGRGLPEA